ncbi:Stress-response A/B barrel domain-containing protein [Glycine soja]|uniref:Stress-response A/B barrel domain-containing protein n=1 Tax=Glycine soja TaxID=3848 RepID=A0A445JV91_GLYSO|nr:Stress-response A/B barrel domain-containing protein [Glycine soja]
MEGSCKSKINNTKNDTNLMSNSSNKDMAGGLTEIGDGRNQPSTSEATNAYYVVGLMGLAYGHTHLLTRPMESIKFQQIWKGRGKDIESHDMLRQGFTHVFLMAFNGKDEFNAFQTHPYDLEFTGVFSPAIKKIVVMDFPSNLVKALA